MYSQRVKSEVRHSVIKIAVENLTINRAQSSVVPRNYVRKIYDYYNSLDEESTLKNEVLKIEKKHILAWEKLHDSMLKNKKPEDLCVCYLCGPQPNNDFQEFIDFGILPQNIWAFELNKSVYKQALKTYTSGIYPQPRIIKQNIDTFFKNTPKKFDIIYIDACGSIPSDQHNLKSIFSLFKYVRLKSPGVLITNFASPDISENIEDFIELVSLYTFFKNNENENLKIEFGYITDKNYEIHKENVRANFTDFYSEFISMILRDLPSVFVPMQRIIENPYINQILEIRNNNFCYEQLMELSKNNNIARFIFTVAELKRNNIIFPKVESLINEIGDFDLIVKSLKFIISFNYDNLTAKDDIEEIVDYFKGNNIYQFLDNVHENMFFDIILNQLAYPMHYNCNQNTRYSYIAKTRKMMLDVMTYDECRYIYEWLPAMHQIVSAFENKSWQYVFRFALDGLVKSRKNYNNELFFQGSVISENIDGFGNLKIKDRIFMNEWRNVE